MAERRTLKDLDFMLANVTKLLNRPVIAEHYNGSHFIKFSPAGRTIYSGTLGECIDFLNGVSNLVCLMRDEKPQS